MRPLSLLESRVLGVLVEKAHTVPDSYPLSLNSLTLGCNQKTARDPVLAASEGEVQAAVDALKLLSLAFESSGSRVSRYEHNLGRALGLPSQSAALLAVLMLRGPQTSAELRARTERLHPFASVAAVDDVLAALGRRGLARLNERRPGEREARWHQLVSSDTGPASAPVARVAEAPAPFAAAPAEAETESLGDRVAELEAQVADLRARLEQLESDA
jgi:uncharacterized protein YceH (UPF0502 family)